MWAIIVRNVVHEEDPLAYGSSASCLQERYHTTLAREYGTDNRHYDQLIAPFFHWKEVYVRQLRFIFSILLLSLSGCTASSEPQLAFSVAQLIGNEVANAVGVTELVALPPYPHIRQSAETSVLDESTTLATLRTTFDTMDAPEAILAWYTALLQSRGWPDVRMPFVPGASGDPATKVGYRVVETDYSGCPLKNVQITLKQPSTSFTEVTLEHRLMCNPDSPCQVCVLRRQSHR
jgi:hypothetical protein